ncbi:MAG: transketolase [Oscillospiraceae bacterium]|nr:transketolase [Oscillospiraceae bacterium]
MRSTFVQVISRLAREDPKVMLVIGDTGFSVMEPFEAEFGPRFVNVGIAEQNFVSFSAGLAAMGMKPFAYNVVSFMTLRSAEQIMLDVCYQENPVILVGVGGGFAYGTAGPTHHALQDIAMMRAFPNIDVYCPADPAEMEAVMLTAYRRQRPAYIRIGRSVDAPIHEGVVDVPVQKVIPISKGTDIAILACGTILREAVQARKLLEGRGCSVSLYSVPCVQPLDEEAVLACAGGHRAVFTMEEHGITGGLGSAVAELLMEHGKYPPVFHRYGVPDSFAMLAGSRDYQLDYFGLSPEKAAEDMWNRWRGAQ